MSESKYPYAAGCSELSGRVLLHNTASLAAPLCQYDLRRGSSTLQSDSQANRSAALRMTFQVIPCSSACICGEEVEVLTANCRLAPIQPQLSSNSFHGLDAQRDVRLQIHAQLLRSLGDVVSADAAGERFVLHLLAH